MMMTHRSLTLAATTALALLGWSLAETPAHSQGQAAIRRSVEYVNGLETAGGEVLVRVRAGTPAARIAALERAADAAQSQPLGSNGWRVLRSTTRSSQALLSMLAAHPDVERVEPNYIVRTTAIPNDPQFPSLWGLRNTTTPNADIHAVNAWDISTGGTSTVVGVVDTGIDYNHPDLAANVWSAPTQFTVTIGSRSLTCPAGSHGFNAIAFSQFNDVAACNPMDDNNHGTHVSGTIGAVGNNGTGVAGVNWTARIMGLKFLDSSGSGAVNDAVNAIEFAIQTKAFFATRGGGANVRVLSNSWGGGGASQSLFNEIMAANAADMLFPAAAGNNGTNNDSVPFYPASFNSPPFSAPNVIAVAATDINDALAGFSDFGAATVDLAAPGVGIVSTVRNGGFASFSGTSMATPHVAGVANLLLSKCTLTTAQLRQAITGNVDVIPSVTGVTITNGRLNADKAIRSCAPASGGATTATFLGTDTATQGSWKNVYGADGFEVVANSVNYPSYATVVESGQQSFTWAATTAEVRALQKAAAADRLAATLFSPTTFTIDVNLTDGKSHQVALYVLDFDTTSRTESIELRDAVTNAILDTRTAFSFSGGQYLKWKISGHVAIRVTRLAGNNAVVSGVFFDTVGNVPPDVTLTSPTEGQVFVPAPATMTLAATATDSDGIDRVEFYSDTAGLIGTSRTPPYGGTLSGLAAGAYTLTAKAFDTLGATRTSAPVHVTVSSGGGGGTSAVFAGTDTATQGSWRGVYGTSGFQVVNDATANPPFATVTPSGADTFTWSGSTADPRALQKAANPSDRLAATLFAALSFTIDVNITDGQTHRLALYLLDWDSTSRAETIEIRDSTSNTLLDSQPVSGFNNGKYLKWTVGGHVKITVIRNGGINPVVSGVFLD